jgi:hypothetical protein
METSIFGNIAQALEATDEFVRAGCEQFEKQVVEFKEDVSLNLEALREIAEYLDGKVQRGEEIKIHWNRIFQKPSDWDLEP